MHEIMNYYFMQSMILSHVNDVARIGMRCGYADKEENNEVLFHFVILVGEDYRRLELLRFFKIHQGV